MPEPQPGAEGPAAGNTPAPPPSTAEGPGQGLPDQSSSSSVPIEKTVAQPPSAATADTSAQPTTAQPTTAEPRPGQAGTGQAGLDPTRLDRDTPDATRIDRDDPPGEATSPAAPRWSGSAAVPPPKPRKRGWGHSAEPTPPPMPAPPLGPPESQTPVDPWAGADTGSWDLNAGLEPPSSGFGPPSSGFESPSSGFAPPLPPTTPAWPAPSPTTPAWSPPPPTTPAWSPPPATPPPPVTPPPVARPVSPPSFLPPAPAPQARPVSPPPARPVSPPPARPAPAPPPASVPQQRHTSPPPAAPAPNAQQAQRRAPAPAPRKRRRWPSRILIMALLSVLCCCGCPAYFGKPMWEQYPASASLPPQVADLRLREDARSESAMRELRAEIEEQHTLAEDVFAGIYRSRQGKEVLVFGTTGFRLTPGSDAEAELTRLAGRYNLGDQQVVETGVRGEHQRCAVGRLDGGDVVVCTWADHGSIANAVFTRLSLTDSATLLGTLRERIVTRG